MESVPNAVTSSLSGDAAPCGDLQSPNLCDRHCAYGSSATAQATSGSFPPFVATPLPWRIEETSVAVVHPRAYDEEFLRFEPPPPLILFGVLRI
jgi:hypothetical protein